MSAGFDQLMAIMNRLRGKDGCPWDREQTSESLKPFLLEEAYEVLEAIEGKDPETLREELGDLLFQVIFHARIASERGDFTIEDVLSGLSEKMVRRHPHVFAGARVRTAREAIARWEKLKNRETRNRRRKSALDGVPRQLPALLRAHQLQARAARMGFDWPDVEPVWDKIDEELLEARQSVEKGNRGAIEWELGDLLFSIVNLARFLRIEPEEALRKTNQRFISRFESMEKSAKTKGRSLAAMSLREMDRLWNRAKKMEKKNPQRKRR